MSKSNRTYIINADDSFRLLTNLQSAINKLPAHETVTHIIKSDDETQALLITERLESP